MWKILDLYRLLSPRRRWQLWALIGLMLVSALLELGTLASLVPFLAVIEGKEVGKSFLRLMDMAGVDQGVVSTQMVFVLFVSIATFSTASRLLLAWTSTRLTYAMGADLSAALVESTLVQPYKYHVQHNSSETIAGLSKVLIVLHGIFTPLIQTVISLILTTAMLGALLVINTKLTLLILVILPASYAVIFLGSRYQFARNSKSIAVDEQDRVQTVQEAVGGIRDVILYRHQSLYTGRFARTEHHLRRAQAINSFLGSSPRHFIELVGLLLIATVCYVATAGKDPTTSVIALMGPVVLGMQRMLPQVQQIYYGWTSLVANRHSLDDVLRILKLPKPLRADTRQVSFNRSIELRGVSYKHAERAKETLSNVNITIHKGSRVGVVGTTGSGKSTFVDLVMGLLEPSSGQICVDGVALDAATVDSWQERIAHVPQTIYLSDASIADNIALGTASTSHDPERMRAVCRAAQLTDFLHTLPAGLDTVVGEGGVKLSGGQRQRIGIARALYRHAQLLVLDEATSALDSETEFRVIRAINELSPEITIIMIAHRKSTLRACDAIFQVAHGRVVRLEAAAYLADESTVDDVDAPKLMEL
jgi:ATP-binding cassette, subfamily B, bacterial PglK